MPTLYDFEVTTIEGEKVSLSLYKNKVLLIVNVASHCGFTPQYKELEALYQKYQSQEFSILAFPCNQFKHQESGNEEEILNFCQINYGVSFPLFSKIDVNGEQADPLYNFLKSEQKGIFGTQAIKWNFTKFLISKEGKVLERFAPSTTPLSIETRIQEELVV